MNLSVTPLISPSVSDNILEMPYQPPLAHYHDESTFCRVFSYVNYLSTIFSPFVPSTPEEAQRRFLKIIASKAAEEFLCLSHLPIDSSLVQKVALNALEYYLSPYAQYVIPKTPWPREGVFETLFSFDFSKIKRYATQIKTLYQNMQEPLFKNILRVLGLGGVGFYETYYVDQNRFSYYRTDFIEKVAAIMKDDNLEAFKTLIDEGILDFSASKNISKERWTCMSAQFGALHILDFLIKSGVSVNATYFNWTPLMYAAKYNQYEAVQWLLNHHADPNQCLENGYNPLYTASENNRTDILNALLNAFANPNKNFKDWTPLHHAADTGKIQILNELLNFKADPNLPGPQNQTALYFTINNNHEDCALSLLKHKADPNQEVNGWPPLYLATAKNATQVVQELLKLQANPNQKMKDGWTPLHSAADTGKTPILNELLNFQADPNERGPNNITALYFAIDKNHPDCALSLLKHGANPNQEVNGGLPIYSAAVKSNTDLVIELLKKGANPDLKIKEGWAPLHHAADTGKTPILNALLNFKADPNIPGPQNWTALHFAINNNHPDCALSLLKHGADPNQEINGWPVLYTAVTKNSTDLVIELLKKGANPNQKMKDGWTPLHHAADTGKTPILNSLLHFKADPNIPGPLNWTALHFAINKNHLECAQSLLEHGADPNEVESGSHRLYYPMAKGDVEFVKLLLKNKVDVDKIDPYGYSVALTLAEFNEVSHFYLLLPHIKNLDLDAKLLVFGSGEIPTNIRKSHEELLEEIKTFSSANAEEFNLLKENLRATMLTYFFKNKHYHLANVLIQKGASIQKAFRACGYFLADYILSSKDPLSTLEILYLNDFKSDQEDGLNHDLSFYFDMLMQDSSKNFDKIVIKNLIREMYEKEFKRAFDSDQSLLDFALKNKDLDRAAALIHTGIDLNQQDGEGKSGWDKMSNEMREKLSLRQIQKPWYKFW